MAVFEKKDGALVFNWTEGMLNKWELGGEGEPHATIELIDSKFERFAVHAKLVMPKLHGKRFSGYDNKTAHRTEEKALAMAEEEKRHIEKTILGVMGSDFVLKALSKEDAVDYSVKGISTCARCGKKFTTDKKYHRYCDECGEKVKGGK